MGVVTGIVESSKQDGRYTVQVDGRAFATVSLDILDRLHLRVGLPMNDELGAAVEEAAAVLKTYDRALGLLAFQARSARDLRTRLLRKGEPAANVDAAVERLVANGLLNDADYARQLARSRVLGQGASRRRVQQEMFKHGVARDVGDEAIAEVFEDEAVDEGELVERVARKKMRAFAKLDPETRRRRLYAFLARRGYESDAIRRAMAAVLDGAEAEAAVEAIEEELE
jgi:regulatory protein